jgi:hypothetical protein
MNLGIVQYRFGQSKVSDPGTHSHSNTRTQTIVVAKPVTDAGVEPVERVHELANGIAADGHGFLTSRQVAQQGGYPDDGHDDT